MPIPTREIQEIIPIKITDQKIPTRSLESAIPSRPISLTDMSDFGNEGKNAFSKMSTFGKILDVLGRPGNIIKSIILDDQREQKEIIEKLSAQGLRGDELRDTFAEQYYDTTKKENVTRKLDVAWKALSGEERTSANKLWEEMGIKDVPLLGFATEIMTDPLMWGGGAGYKAIAKGVTAPIKLAGKGISMIPGVAKATQYATAKIEPVTTALKDMFINKTGLAKLNDLIETHLTKRQYMQGKEIQFGVKTRNVIQNVSKKTGQSIDDIEKQIVNTIEQPNVIIEGLAPETKALANTLKSHLTNILTTEMKAGVPITALSEGSRGIQYFPRITTKEATQYLKQAKIGNSKIWNSKLANSLRRRTQDFTLQEFNDFVKANGLESLGGRSVEEFFMQNPAYAVATRGYRSAKAVTSAEFLNETGKIFGQTVDKAPSFWTELPESVTKLNPSLKGLKFDPEVTSEIMRTTKAYFNPDETKTFVKIFDIVQNSWKKWTLAPFPKYHLRNMVGNIWNNYLAGVNPKEYAKAQAIQMYRKYGNKEGILNKTALKDLQLVGISPQQADDIIVQAEKTGVLGHGWYGGDIETTIERAVKGEKGIIGKGMAFGSTIENNARLAHFIDRLDKGDDALKSAQSVKKYLFDYGDLTDFEKQVMKRLMPFYSWTRKNIPLQAENLIAQPQKYAPLAIPLRNREPKDLLRLKYARPDLYERLPVELKRDIDTVTYVPLEGLIPAGDLTKMGRPQEILSELLTPYLRTSIELLINKSFYSEREIQKYPGETQQLLRMDIPVKLKYVLTSVLPQARLIGEMDKIVKKQISTKKETLTPAEQAFSQSLSSIYKTNIKDLRDQALRNIEKKVEELKNGVFWAKRNQRPEEYKRIKETYEELKSLMKNLK